MADITMCTGEKCPLKHLCYRHTATPSKFQLYFTVPLIKDNQTCNFFKSNIEIQEEAKRIESLVEELTYSQE